MSHRPGIGTGKPGRDIKQVAKPIRVIRIVADPTMSYEALAECFGARWAGGTSS